MFPVVVWGITWQLNLMATDKLIYSVYNHLAFYISINEEKQQHSLYLAFTDTY